MLSGYLVRKIKIGFHELQGSGVFSLEFVRPTTFTVMMTCLLASMTSCKQTAEKSSVSTMARPSASEAFHLRSECAVLADKIYNDKEDELGPTINMKNYAWWHSIDHLSHYDPATNRCFVELTVNSTSRSDKQDQEWARELYDGQTKEMLASTIVHEANHNKDFGYIYVATSARYRDGVEGARDFIDNAMNDDRSNGP